MHTFAYNRQHQLLRRTYHHGNLLRYDVMELNIHDQDRDAYLLHAECHERAPLSLYMQQLYAISHTLNSGIKLQCTFPFLQVQRNIW